MYEFISIHDCRFISTSFQNITRSRDIALPNRFNLCTLWVSHDLHTSPLRVSSSLLLLSVFKGFSFLLCFLSFLNVYSGFLIVSNLVDRARSRALVSATESFPCSCSSMSSERIYVCVRCRGTTLCVML